MIPVLDLSNITDLYIRRNFERIAKFLKSDSPLDGFRPIAATLTSTGTVTIKHALGFQPKDIILTSLVGGGTVVFNNSQFTATELSVTVGGTVSTSSPTVIRFLVGTLGGLL